MMNHRSHSCPGYRTHSNGVDDMDVLTIVFLSCISIAVLAVFGLLMILILCSPVVKPFLKCKMKSGMSLVGIACDDGSMRLLSLDARDLVTTKKYGSLIFDKKARYAIGGVPFFLLYNRGPPTTVPLTTFLAADKLRHLGVKPVCSTNAVADAATAGQMIDHENVAAAIADYAYSLLSADELKTASDALDKLVE